jgi:hypothetical protein
MFYSSFDEFVNKILKESLIGGNISSTSISPAQPQLKKQVNKTKQGYVQPEPPTQPIQNNQQKAQSDQTSNDIKALIAQMKEDEKKNEEFQKKLIATQTAQQKSVTAQTQQPTTQTNIPPSGNIDIKQILSALA